MSICRSLVKLILDWYKNNDQITFKKVFYLAMFTYLTGILIHGMGGMGKSSLAVEGCRRLYIEDKWNVYKIDLRYLE